MRIIISLFLLSTFALLSTDSMIAKEKKLPYEMATVGTHEDEVLGVFVNEDDTKVATCSLDETIKIWDLNDGKELKHLKGHFGQVNNISFSGNDKWLASASGDLTVRVWNVETGENNSR